VNAALIQHFPSPTFQVSLLASSDPNLDFYTQLRAVARAHVVITNHGAFEGNMIFMRNRALLVELFGHYGNNEIHTFHRLATMFEVFYSRLHCRQLTDHYQKEYNMSRVDINELIRVVSNYFEVKPFAN
jgi:hypothetical protein